MAAKPFKVTTQQLVAEVARSTEMTYKDTHKVVSSLVEHTAYYLAEGYEVKIKGLGIFKPKYKAAYKNINPRTLEPMIASPSIRVRFIQGTLLKEKIQSRL